MPDPAPIYPVSDFGPLMKGMVIGGVGIVHVFLAQFAIGGGLLMTYFERLAARAPSPTLRRTARLFQDGFFKTLVLISFVAGALTGVAMWLTTIQVGARTIGMMIDEFHWVWAVEWCCFALEVVAGYAFLRWGQTLTSSSRATLLGLYAAASWGSLFFINGILSWQLTPGGWADGGGLWAGFFNPSFWPSLLFRTVVAATLAALVASLLIDRLELPRPERAELLHHAARLLAPMVLMPLVALWYLAVIPADSRSWLLGGSIAMTLFVAIAAGASVLIGAYALLGVLWRRRYVSAPTAALLLALAFAATGAGEMVREGARKPFTVRGALYSTSMTPAEVAARRVRGAVYDDPYPVRDGARYPTEQLRHGARVFRALCAVCHTMSGANAVTHLTASWTVEQLRMNLAMLQRTKPFMPPFAGTAADVEATVQLVRWQLAGRPRAWPEGAAAADAAVLARITAWLDEAGTGPGGPDRAAP